MNTFLSPLGRAGLSLIFIISGWGKIAGYASTQQYMEMMGVTGALMTAGIAMEPGGGVAIIPSAFLNGVALELAPFSIAQPATFHADSVNTAKTPHYWQHVTLRDA